MTRRGWTKTAVIALTVPAVLTVWGGIDHALRQRAWRKRCNERLAAL